LRQKEEEKAAREERKAGTSRGNATGGQEAQDAGRVNALIFSFFIFHFFKAVNFQLLVPSRRPGAF
jgi:hypothetical protein